jgi:hypothetical protein
MPWQGSWNGGVYNGTYTAPDGTVFTGTWTPPNLPDPPSADPQLSSYDPFFLGAPLNNPDPLGPDKPWQGSYAANGVWNGKYRAPDGTVFEGTMAKTYA